MRERDLRSSGHGYRRKGCLGSKKIGCGKFQRALGTAVTTFARLTYGSCHPVSDCIELNRGLIEPLEHGKEQLYIFLLEASKILGCWSNPLLSHSSIFYLPHQYLFEECTLAPPPIQLSNFQTYQSLLSQLTQPSPFVSGLPSQTYIYGSLKLPSVSFPSAKPPPSSSRPVVWPSSFHR